VGRDEARGSGQHEDEVSIHAPVWGATNAGYDTVPVDVVSIHAPVWGATLFTRTIQPDLCFNPRARVGRDFSTFGIARPKASFNPRARVGRDVL